MAANDRKQQTNDDVASAAQNDKLEHSQGGKTTRDALDAGVPMLPGDPSEPVGPEDALGESPTRGDYRNRLGESNYQPHTAVRVPDAKPGEPQVRLESQREHTENIGEVKARKGGVDA